jgi:DNA-binding FadR family transcriptional regulator
MKDTVFKQARQNRTFENILSQIQESILEGKLKQGDKLPSERDLRDIFKVSRGTLREALRALEQKKLIQIRTGVNGGAFVRQLDTQQISESLDLLLRYQKISLKELEEFREAVEPLVAAQATKKASKTDIKKLRMLVDSMGKGLIAKQPDYDDLIGKDREFHLTLSRISRNRVFESVLGTVYENINRYFDTFLPKDAEILKATYKDLRKIVVSIEAKDPDKVHSMVQRHIAKFAATMTGSKESLGVKSRRSKSSFEKNAW